MIRMQQNIDKWLHTLLTGPHKIYSDVLKGITKGVFQDALCNF